MIRFFDSFDHYGGNGATVTSLMTSKGWTFNQTNTVSNVTRFSSGFSMSNGNNGGTNTQYINFDNQSTWIVGVAFYPKSNLGVTSFNLIQVADGGSSQVEVQVVTTASGAQFYLNRNGTNLAGPSATVYPFNQWVYLEFKAVINNSTGSVELKVNSSSVLSFSGNTRATSNNFASRIYLNMIALGGGVGAQMYVDDFYVADGQGSINNSWIGEARIEADLPTSDSTTVQWTPNSGTSHYTRVNQQTPDDDTSYVSSSNPGDIDEYKITPSSVQTIVAVQLIAYARKDDAGLRQVAPVSLLGSTQYVGTTMTLGTSYGYGVTRYETNPDTNNPFTNSDLTNGAFGVKEIA